MLNPEDIIGLKVQAIANEQTREALDFQDMRLLFDYKVKNNQQIDWELLNDYFVLFKRNDLLEKLQKEFK